MLQLLNARFHAERRNECPALIPEELGRVLGPFTSTLPTHWRRGQYTVRPFVTAGTMKQTRVETPTADAGQRPLSFDQMVETLVPLTYVLNNLNRCMGLHDAYPFVLATLVLNKLRFVHEVVRGPFKPLLRADPTGRK